MTSTSDLRLRAVVLGDGTRWPGAKDVLLRGVRIGRIVRAGRTFLLFLLASDGTLHHVGVADRQGPGMRDLASRWTARRRPPPRPGAPDPTAAPLPAPPTRTDPDEGLGGHSDVLREGWTDTLRARLHARLVALASPPPETGDPPESSDP